MSEKIRITWWSQKICVSSCIFHEGSGLSGAGKHTGITSKSAVYDWLGMVRWVGWRHQPNMQIGQIFRRNRREDQSHIEDHKIWEAIWLNAGRYIYQIQHSDVPCNIKRKIVVVHEKTYLRVYGMVINWRDGYFVLVGLIFLLLALFLPGIKEAFLPEQTIQGWVLVALSAAALLETGKDTISTILGLCFISNSLFFICTLGFPLLHNGPLKAASWLCVLLTTFAIVITLFFVRNTHFAIGHYLWLLGMSMVTLGFFRSAKATGG